MIKSTIETTSLKIVTLGVSLTALTLTMFLYRNSLNTLFKKLGWIQIRAKNPKNIILVESEEQCVKAINILKSKCVEFPALGFDCEWITSSSGKRAPVALMQLGTYDGVCVLIRLCKLQNCFNVELKNLMANEKILKVGVASGDDAKYLNNDYHFDVKGWIDLRHLAHDYFITSYNKQTLFKKIKNYFSKETPKPLPISDGLAGLSSKLLNYRLSKDWRVRCSNWEAPALSTNQMHYAARDALVALDLFDIFHKSKSLKEISTFKNVPYKAKNQLKYISQENNKNSNGNKQMKRHYSTMNQPLYQNCFLEAPDGEPLSTCSKKKAEWYISQNLGSLVREDPLTVRLLFEPSGRCKGEADMYYLQPQRNICVVCGAADSHLRKNIVPHEYRRHLPTLMKNHSCHDVLLLCVECHAISSRYDDVFRRKLEEQCEAPIAKGLDRKVFDIPGTKEIRSAGRALLSKKAGLIPKDRKENLERLITNYFGVEKCTQQLIEEAAILPRTTKNEDYEPHGLRVVQWYSYHDGLVELERLWRTHFLESMKPKFLPAFWSVSHTSTRLREKAEQKRVTPEEMTLVGLS